ncbi:EIN3-binding F-box protein 1-like [Rhodamnia argentea]|uniref:EIN3-binding F-box protein 1-like n=1 Tax=Rhodamnia argentea TaxID=178133 RepID=A0A8B8PHZ7_9MYRT|nr:EIN3-binding F-box protein 1-like [Rhodamnia argentea]
MSKVLCFAGGDDFYSGGSIYPSPKEASLFLSLGNHVDVYFPPRKRSRISAPFVFSEDLFEQKRQDTIEALPDECLFEIFRRLPGGQERSACACVSKRWLMLLSNICPNELSCDKSQNNLAPTNVGEEVISEDDGFLSRSLEGKKATDIRLAAIAVGTADRGGLGKLSIRGSKLSRVTNLGLGAIAHGCPSLRSLSLWHLPFVGDEGLLEVANGCHQLEKLDLCQCPKITDKFLVAVAKNCPNLIDISIESCSGIGNEGLVALGQFCQNLKSISIKNCPSVGDQGIVGLISRAGGALTKVKLQALNVTDVSIAVIGHYAAAVTDLSLTSLHNVTERGFWVMGNGHGLQRLRSLIVAACRGATDLGLESLGKGCPNLKQLYISSSAFLSDGGLVSLIKSARSLESLQLEECHRITLSGLFGLVIDCGDKLKSLALTNCWGFKEFDFSAPQLSSCKSLHSLSVRNCPGFVDACLVALGKICPHLQQVELSGLAGITDDGLLQLLECCEAGLVKVNLSGCINLTDQVVSAMAKLHSRTLEALILDGCTKIGDLGLLAIAENCQLLSDLDVSKCAISDSGLTALASSSQLNLQVLSVSGCSLVSDNCLPALKKVGHTLLGLNLQHCTAISSRSVDLLLEELWRCDILA